MTTRSRVWSDWLPGQRANRRNELPAIVCAFLSTPNSSTDSSHDLDRDSAPATYGVGTTRKDGPGLWAWCRCCLTTRNGDD